MSEPHPIGVDDRLDILDLYARQAHAIDGGDGAGWAATFTEDGVFESPTYRLVATGRAALQAFAETSNAAALGRGEQLRHHLNSIVITGSARAASVRAYLMILATSTAGARVDRSLTVTDELVRTDDGWRLTSRRVFRDAP